MPAPLARFVAALLLLALCLPAADDGTARVVHDGKSALSRPVLEKGGVHLNSKRDPAVPYSLIGAIALQGQWLMTCALVPLQRLGWSHPYAAPQREPWTAHDSFMPPLP